MDFRRIFLIILSLALVVAVFYYLSDIVAYIIIAWVISMLGEPILQLFLKIKIGKKIKMGRIPASFLTLITMIAGFSLIFLVFIPLVIEQANNLASVEYNQIYETLQDPLNAINSRLIELGIISEEEVGAENFKEVIGDYFKPSYVSNLVSGLFGFAGSLFIGFFSVLFIAFFFLKDEKLFTNFILAMVPVNREGDTLTVIHDISKLLRKYFAGIILQITVITIFVTTMLSIFGIKNALLIAFFAAIINVIPYVGPFIGGIFGIFITISSNLNVDFYTVLTPMLIKVVITFVTMQLLDNFILQPFIFSNSVKAHPLEIFIVILVAAKIGGILGMILAIPTYTVIRVIAREFLFQFKIVQKLTGSLE